MSDSFVPPPNSEEYNDRWRLLDPALCSYQSIEPSDDFSRAHLVSLKRRLSDLTNSANGRRILSSTTMLDQEFAHMGLQTPFSSNPQTFHGLRYMSPNGHFGGSLSSVDSAPSECASSPDAARHSAQPFYTHYDSQEIYSSPSYDEGAAFGNWESQKVYPHSIIHSPSSFDSHTACNLKDLQYTPDPDLDVDEEPIEDNDCIKVERRRPAELLLSPGTSNFRDEALGQSIRDDASSSRDEEEDRYEESEADSEYNPQRPRRRNSGQVKSPGRKTPKRKTSINNTVLGDAKVTKPAQRRQNSTRGPSTRPAKSASNAQKRVFTCAFWHYGCEATFGSKNEWKRHVASQHLQLGFYRCDTGFCDPEAQSSSAKPHPSAEKSYNDFNRKDLFTQHHRRMHTPWSSASKEPTDKVKRDFENALEDVRKRCWHERRKPPQRSTCGFCRKIFEGPKRMEQVGKHFEGKHHGDEDVSNVQEEEDEDLREWAVREGIVGAYGTKGFWLVGMEPVEVKAGAGRSGRRRGKGQQEARDEEDVDAEGENE
jgi:hypothetical protein